ncbi:MAG TPA: uroporphyrinogen-III synthase [Thermoanaerobaculia bacterium]
MNRPRVLVVRSGANPFASVGQSSSMDIVERVSHTIQPLDPGEEPFAQPARLTIFTSQVAVERCISDPKLERRLRDAIAGGQVAAVGTMTAEALRRYGIEPQLVGKGSAESILQSLPSSLAGWRVLLPCGEDASSELPEGLRHRVAHVERAVVYRKAPRPRDASFEREVTEHPFAAFLTTSPSAAIWLFERLPDAPAARLRATPAVVLGRFTRRLLETYGVAHIETAPEAHFGAALHTLERLAGVPAPE